MARQTSTIKKHNRDDGEQQDQEVTTRPNTRRKQDEPAKIQSLPNEIIDQIIFYAMVDDQKPVCLRRQRATRRGKGREIEDRTVKSAFTSLSLVSKDFHTAAVECFFRNDCFEFSTDRGMDKFVNQADRSRLELMTTIVSNGDRRSQPLDHGRRPRSGLNMIALILAQLPNISRVVGFGVDHGSVAPKPGQERHAV